MSGASFDTLMRRASYGGRKGRAAKRRINRGQVWTHPLGGMIRLGMPWNHQLPLTREPVSFTVAASYPVAALSPVSGAEFVDTIHKELPDAFSDLDGPIHGDEPR